MSRKKHVIPRNEYKRNRREFFHNEEREKRIENEKLEAQKRRALQEEKKKNNEQRVKDNFQKARIEKLTKEEIKKQNQKAETYPILDLDNKSSNDKETKDNNQEISHKHKSIEETYENSEDKSPKEERISEANDFETNRKLGAKHDEQIEKEAQKKNNNVNKLLNQIEKHWPIIAIILAIILIFILVWSIFQNVNPPNESRQKIEDKQSQKGFQKPITNIMEAVEKSKYAVVGVSHKDSNVSNKKESSQEKKEENSGVGSGVIYKIQNGTAYIVTNAHVLSEDKTPTVTTENGKKHEAKTIGSDQWSDIAVIKMPVNKNMRLKSVKFEDSDNLILGEPSIIIGSPLGDEFQNSVSTGVVSGLKRKVPVDLNNDQEYDWEINAIQTDAAVNPGNSGGPILDSQGNLIGIISLKIDMPNVEGMGFAIPSNEAKSYINKIEKDGEIKRPELGIKAKNYNSMSDQEKTQYDLPKDTSFGLVIQELDEKGAAYKSGFKFNDIIVGIGNKKIQNNLEFRKELYNNHKIGDKINVKIYRDGKKENKTLTLK